MTRIVLYLTLLLTLALPALAQTPESVVRQLYGVHRKNNNLEKTLLQSRKSFTPGFLKVLDAASQKTPDDGDFLDYDFLINSQDSWSDFEVGHGSIQGKEAVVPVRLWMGTQGQGKSSKVPIYRAKVLLTDTGHGYQIRDIQHLSTPVKYPDGQILKSQAHSVRTELDKIAQARGGKSPRH